MSEEETDIDRINARIQMLERFSHDLATCFHAHDPMDPAVRAALCVDRDAGGTERVHVAVDRALADLELGRQHRGRRSAARLEEQEQLDEP